ncbi:restriction endonuclease subunit S [Burkholderia contaminans]|nr:restriction endonuclease subunit S [Burkholderia contaminans]
MSKMTRHRFNDLYQMASGISSKPEQAGHGAPFLSFSAVFNNYFLPDELPDWMDTSEHEQRKYSIHEGDIFLTRTSEVIDELGMSSVALKNYQKATYSGFLKRLRPINQEVTYPKFMAFYLRSPLFRKTMTNNAVLTLRASLNEEIFSYLDLLLPEYDDQIRVGDFLYLLSQKIECNGRIYAQLEAMAKTLYDYWFVQFDFPDANGNPYKSAGGKMVYNAALKREIPAGWDSALIADILDKAPTSTKVLNKNLLETGPIPVIDQSQKYICGFTDERSSLIDPKQPHVVFGDHTRAVKLANFGYARGADGTQILVSKSQRMPGYLMYQAVSNIDLSSYGYARHFKFLKESVIIIPEQMVAQKYQKVVTPWYEKTKATIFENLELTRLRDWLLPLLISGQVKAAGS